MRKLTWLVLVLVLVVVVAGGCGRKSMTPAERAERDKRELPQAQEVAFAVVKTKILYPETAAFEVRETKTTDDEIHFTGVVATKYSDTLKYKYMWGTYLHKHGDKWEVDKTRPDGTMTPFIFLMPPQI